MCVDNLSRCMKLELLGVELMTSILQVQCCIAKSPVDKYSMLVFSLRFNGHFPGDPGSAGVC